MPATLDPAIQGIDFDIEVCGIRARALVPVDVLMDRFGATEAPATWLQAFERHEATIRKAAEIVLRMSPARVVILDEQSPGLRQS